MKVVILPFRQREPQLKRLLPELRQRFDCVIIVEQARGKPFNRGAVKHAGVLKELLPNDVVYFHDVDLLPGKDFPNYPDPGENAVVSLYGHRHCLGGIVGMHVSTYRRVGGFCLDRWAWGGEDTQLQLAVESKGITIDRTLFIQRFTNDNAMTELNDRGIPMSGRQARLLFLQQQQQHRQQENQLYEPLVFQGYGRYHNQGNVTHIVLK